MKILRLATRGSALAMAQSEIVASLLEKKADDEGIPLHVEFVKVTTHGDRDQTSRLREIGGNGLFVRAIEEAILDGKADIAVHSGKDLPYELHPDLTIAGIPKAGDPRDVLLIRPGEHREALLSPTSASGVPGKKSVSSEDSSIKDAPIIGTGSPRRIAELSRLLPNADFRENRGNIDTRIRKLREGQFDGIVLAKAGIDRLHPDLSGLSPRIFSPEECMPAGCQGILAVECRKDDSELRKLLGEISDPLTAWRFRLERTILRRLNGDCSIAAGAYASVSEDGSGRFTLSAMYRGKRASVTGDAAEETALLEELYRRLQEDG